LLEPKVIGIGPIKTIPPYSAFPLAPIIAESKIRKIPTKIKLIPAINKISFIIFIIIKFKLKNMKAFILTLPLGSFLINEEGKVLDYKLFPKDSKECAEKFLKSFSSLIKEESNLFEKNKQKFEIYFLIKKENLPFEKNKKEIEFKSRILNFLIENKIFESEISLNQFLSEVYSEITKIKMKESLKKDLLVIQAIRAIEELDKSINVFIERLREWYGLHFPELEKAIKEGKSYAEIVKKYGRKENIPDKKLKPLIEQSIGINLEKDDEEMIKYFASRIFSLYELREKLVNYLDKVLKEIAPNLQYLAGTLLTARLISKAGSLEKLAKMASSTIQLIGAEKALFRYLRGRGKTPKHGIIFTHPLISSSPKKLRGKIARALASKLSIAAKIDYYSKEFRGEELKKDLDEKIKQIKEGKK